MNTPTQKTCPICHQTVGPSLLDLKHLELWGNCWECDNKSWAKGLLSLEEFEERERQALAEAVKESNK